jgi:hypothetical protein
MCARELCITNAIRRSSQSCSHVAGHTPGTFSVPAPHLNRSPLLPITGAMSLEVTLARVSAIRQALADPAELIDSSGGLSGGTQAPSGGEGPGATGGSGSASAASASSGGASFASALEQASGGYQTPASQAVASQTPGSQAPGSQMVGSSLQGAAGTPYATAPYATTPYTSLASLDGVAGASPLSPAALGGQGSTGSRMVAIAESQLGQTEQPPGSNESPAISMYRSATSGAIPGAPWCAYFASWVADQAGAPIGEGGKGAGAVSEVWSWAQSTGRAIPNGPGVVPKPGDLIVFGDEHVGIVRDVLPNGQIQTIEGNYENKVAANVRSPTEATGYVEMS